jgi:hypothetical protein
VRRYLAKGRVKATGQDAWRRVEAEVGLAREFADPANQGPYQGALLDWLLSGDPQQEQPAPSRRKPPKKN